MILPFVLAAATTAGGVAFLINLRILQHEFQQRNLKHTTILNQQNIYCSSAIIIIIIIIDFLRKCIYFNCLIANLKGNIPLFEALIFKTIGEYNNYIEWDYFSIYMV